MSDELLKSLELIKEECKKYERCKGCPLLDACGNCGVMENNPEDWYLEKREVYF